MQTLQYDLVLLLLGNGFFNKKVRSDILFVPVDDILQIKTKLILHLSILNTLLLKFFVIVFESMINSEYKILK